MYFVIISKYIPTHSLIFHTYQYNHDNNITISVVHGEMDPQRTALVIISIQFFKEAKYMRYIQKVTLKLGLIHISDVSSEDGRRLEDTFLKTKQVKQSRNTYDWPSKYHVVTTDYTAWRKLLKHIFRADNYHLPTSLGKWIDMNTDSWINYLDYFIVNDKLFIYYRLGEQTGTGTCRRITPTMLVTYNLYNYGKTLVLI